MPIMLPQTEFSSMEISLGSAQIGIIHLKLLGHIHFEQELKQLKTCFGLYGLLFSMVQLISSSTVRRTCCT